MRITASGAASSTLVSAVALVSALLLGPSPAAAQAYVLDWSTSDGGGGTSSAGTYVLYDTMGQPDAGAAGGGSYSLSSGFWSVAISTLQPTPTTTATATHTPSIPTATPSPTSTATPSPTPSPTPTATPSPTPTATPTTLPVVPVPAPGGGPLWIVLLLPLMLAVLHIRGLSRAPAEQRFQKDRAPR